MCPVSYVGGADVRTGANQGRSGPDVPPKRCQMEGLPSLPLKNSTNIRASIEQESDQADVSPLRSSVEWLITDRINFKDARPHRETSPGCRFVSCTDRRTERPDTAGCL